MPFCRRRGGGEFTIQMVFRNLIMGPEKGMLEKVVLPNVNVWQEKSLLWYKKIMINFKVFLIIRCVVRCLIKEPQIYVVRLGKKP